MENFEVNAMHSGSEDGFLFYVTDGIFRVTGQGWLNRADAEWELSEIREAGMTTCVECKGNGTLSYMPKGEDLCSWCGGYGRVPNSYVVRGYGWNGDWNFSEVWDVCNTHAEAREAAEKGWRNRFNNCLEDGTPTLQGFEISGTDGTLESNEGSGWFSA